MKNCYIHVEVKKKKKKRNLLLLSFNEWGEKMLHVSQKAVYKLMSLTLQVFLTLEVKPQRSYLVFQ